MQYDKLMAAIAERLRQLEGSDAATKMDARKEFMRQVEADIRNFCNVCVLTCTCKLQQVAA